MGSRTTIGKYEGGSAGGLSEQSQKSLSMRRKSGRKGSGSDGIFSWMVKRAEMEEKRRLGQ